MLGEIMLILVVWIAIGALLEGIDNAWQNSQNDVYSN